MNTSERYARFALAREMLETPDILRNFKLEGADQALAAIQEKGKLFLTGEGSGCVFPARNARYSALRSGLDLNIATEGSRQAGEYDLTDFVVFGASNSRRTTEVAWLFDRLEKVGHAHHYAVTVASGTGLESTSRQIFALSCGKEDAVAASKSVAELALFYVELLAQLQGRTLAAKLPQLADGVKTALTLAVDSEITEAIANAGTVYFAGKNDGVAEELALRATEIACKKGNFLDSSSAVHVAAGAMNAGDVMILVNPFATELDRFRERLVNGVGLKVFAVADEETIFPTIRIPDVGELTNFVYLVAGWNILVEVGTHLGIDLDHPGGA